jgi:hypothetical protein
MRFVQTLAFISAAIGCAGTPPRGPHAEFREGVTPIAPPVAVTGSYRLQGVGQPAIEVRNVSKGSIVGFVRANDGSVSAIAPGFKMLLIGTDYTWEVIRESIPPWGQRFREGARYRLRNFADGLSNLLIPLILIGGGVLYAIAAANSHR